jgi:5-formyltetrahydrofolate cyclo-ligase
VRAIASIPAVPRPVSPAAKSPLDHHAGPAAQRRQLRAAALARRQALAAATVDQLGQAICRHLEERFPRPPGRCIAFYWPISNEPDLRPVINAWRAAGVDACLPVVHRRAEPLTFRPWTPGTAMVPDHHGIPTPASGDEVFPDVLFMPVNAFDTAGYRLGYGGGYYDRTLAILQPRPLVIGVGFELARVASILPQAHDVPMDWVVTESGVFAPQRSRPAA